MPNLVLYYTLVSQQYEDGVIAPDVNYAVNGVEGDCLSLDVGEGGSLRCLLRHVPSDQIHVAFLMFFPLPQGQNTFLPIFAMEVLSQREIVPPTCFEC